MTLSDRDLDLALLCASYYRLIGYCSDVKVPLNLPDYEAEYKRLATSDVDSVSIKFEPDFSSSLVITECKSGDRDAASELLKLKGVQQAIASERAILVKDKIHANARHLGRRLRIETLDRVALERLANGVGMQGEFLTDEHRQYSLCVDGAWSVEQRRLLGYLRSEFWFRPFWENIHNLKYLASVALRTESVSFTDRGAWLLMRAGCLTSISVLFLCREVISLGTRDLPRTVGVLLSGGPQARRQRERLLDEISKAVRSRSVIPRSVDPPFVGQLAELVDYMILSPGAAAKVPWMLDALSVAAAGGSSWTGALSETTPETRKLMKDVLEFLLHGTDVRSLKESLPHIYAL